MRPLTRTMTTPIETVRSTRQHPLRVLTSLPAGKMVPLAAVPLLREDGVRSMPLEFSFEMMETVELLMNSVLVHVKAYLVPHLAFERFSGMDELNRSFAGLPNQEGGAVTPYIETADFGTYGANAILKYMGKHRRNLQQTNTAYVEAYNLIWNQRAKDRSPGIPLRTRLQSDLAPAFWQHSMFDHVVPDYDSAQMNGWVPLMPISGKSQLAVKSTAGQAIKLKTLEQGEAVAKSLVAKTNNDVAVTGTAPVANSGLQFADVSNVYAELTANNIVLTLANLKLATQTVAFAKIRERYAEHSDEYIIDMLMDGLTIPEQAYRQPILLGEANTVFGMSKRYASDAGNLTESVVNGMTQIQMNLRTPTVPMGGVIMIVAEITPEQLFERQMDPYLELTSPEAMPHYLRDFMDPEKVEIVTNNYVDTSHASPNGTFGYAPLNHKWNYSAPCIGGKFFRPSVNSSFDEDRQRIWSVETPNPTLSADFYICNSMHVKPFAIQIGDPFEVVVRGNAEITGLTVFGDGLVEGTNNYDEVLEEVNQARVK